MNRKKIIFVTGTDTGVGKTLLTALLLHHQRQNSVHALGMKPFCSGGTADVRLLQSLQAGELSDAQVNPFYFPEPIAPLVAAAHRKPVRLGEVVTRIRAVEKMCGQLLIEGSGGLMVPLGKGYTVADLICELDCQVIVAARNKLGTINHTWLTINALKARGVAASNLSVVLMGMKHPEISSQTNEKTLSTLLKPIRVLGIPYLGEKAARTKGVKKNYLKVKKILERLMG